MDEEPLTKPLTRHFVIPDGASPDIQRLSIILQCFREMSQDETRATIAYLTSRYDPDYIHDSV